MKTYSKFIKSFFFLALIPFVAQAQNFVGYHVYINNVYPDPYVESYLALEGPDAVLPAPAYNASDYCPLPQEPVKCCNQPRMFQYLGCKQTLAGGRAFGASVIYSLFGATNKAPNHIIKILTCKLEYTFANNSCTATATPIDDDLHLAKCTATATYNNGFCEVNFRFSPVAD